MWKYLGEDYDYKGVGYFAWRLFLKRCFSINVRPPDTEKEMFCSELVSRWYGELREVLGKAQPGFSPEEMAPSDLVKLLEGDELFVRSSCEYLLSVMST
jgi:hypothetical protein